MDWNFNAPFSSASAAAFEATVNTSNMSSSEFTYNMAMDTSFNAITIPQDFGREMNAARTMTSAPNPNIFSHASMTSMTSPPPLRTVPQDTRGFTTKTATAYAEVVWQHTCLKRRLDVFPALRGNIINKLNRTRHERTAEQNAACDKWYENSVKQWHRDAENNKRASRARFQLAVMYHNARRANDIVLEPRFYIDPTRPRAVLNIQRKYDIIREARHLCSLILPSEEILRLRNLPGRNEYMGSLHMTDSITGNREMMEIHNLGIGALEGDFIPAEVAKWADVTPHGRPIGLDWDFFNLLQGIGKNYEDSRAENGLPLGIALRQDVTGNLMKFTDEELAQGIEQLVEMSKKLGAPCALCFWPGGATEIHECTPWTPGKGAEFGQYEPFIAKGSISYEAEAEGQNTSQSQSTELGYLGDVPALLDSVIGNNQTRMAQEKYEVGENNGENTAQQKFQGQAAGLALSFPPLKFGTPLPTPSTPAKWLLPGFSLSSPPEKPGEFMLPPPPTTPTKSLKRSRSNIEGMAKPLSSSSATKPVMSSQPNLSDMITSSLPPSQTPTPSRPKKSAQSRLETPIVPVISSSLPTTADRTLNTPSKKPVQKQEVTPAELVAASAQPKRSRYKKQPTPSPVDITATTNTAYTETDPGTARQTRTRTPTRTSAKSKNSLPEKRSASQISTSPQHTDTTNSSPPLPNSNLTPKIRPLTTTNPLRPLSTNPFLRANPYQPTRQTHGTANGARGKPPRNVTRVEWEAAWKEAEKEMVGEMEVVGLKGREREREVRRIRDGARSDGRTRDWALAVLVRAGKLEGGWGFVDGEV